MWAKLFDMIDWFGEMYERTRLVRDFNRSGKSAFISGMAPTLLQARVSSGDKTYKHSFSKFFGSGFRIKALSGRPLTRNEQIEIGMVILNNEELVRKLMSLGWDTLEVHDDKGYNGRKWPLKEFGNLGGLLY